MALLFFEFVQPCSCVIVNSLFLVFIHHLVVLSHDVVLFDTEKLDLELWQDHKQIREKFGSDTFYKASYL